jgi:CHAT domain-containing protein/Tfp pilus assembly protein PilF
LPSPLRAESTWSDLLAQADSLSSSNNQDSAIVLGTLALEGARSKFGGNDTATARVLHRLGVFHGKKSDFDHGERFFQQSVEIRETVLGPDHPELARSLNSLAVLYVYQTKYIEAEPLYERALAIRERILGPSHPDVAISLENMAILYENQDKYAEPESLYQRSLVIREKTLGSDHPDVARSLRYLAHLHAKQGKYELADSLYQRSLILMEKTFGPKHLEVATILNNLAVLYRLWGKYAEAEHHCKRALTIMESALGAEHLDVATGLITLADICALRGQYDESEKLYQRSLGIREKVMGQESHGVATCFNNLADLYRVQGKYADAERLSQKSLTILEKLQGTDNLDFANFLNTLAVIYSLQGKYAESETLHHRSLGIYEHIVGPEHPYVSNSLNNLVSLTISMGKYPEAESLCSKSLAIEEKLLGAEHPNVAYSCNNLAFIYIVQRKYSQAEPLCLRSLAIHEKVLGADHMDVASSLYILAYLYRVQGHFAEADALLKRTLAVQEQTLGPEHPDVSSTLGEIAKLDRLQAHPLLSLNRSSNAPAIRERHFLQNANALSESDALDFYNGTRIAAANYLSCFFACDSLAPSDHLQAVSVILKTKGQIADLQYQRLKSQIEEPDSATLKLFKTLRQNQFLLSTLYVSGPDKDDTTGAYKWKLDSLSALTKRLESDLALQSMSFAENVFSHDVTYEKIASLTPTNSVLVEYLKYYYLQLNPDSNISHYVVAISEKGADPHILDLGEALPIDNLIEQYQKHFMKIADQKSAPSRIQMDEYKTIAKKLYDAVVRPINNHFAGKEVIFVAPDGALNLVSFAGLIDDDGKYLIEKFSFHYLSTGRDILRLNDSIKSGVDLLAIGDPDYNATVDARLGMNDNAAYASVDPVDLYASRNIRSGCGYLSELVVDPLPSTRKEVEAIVKRWNDDKRGKAAVYLGPQASEDNFKAESKGKRIIHLSTHGYFLEGYCSPKQGAVRFGNETGFIGENPLLLSGLLFAGANLHGEGADSAGTDDGILSAYEVSSLDLHGTELVVLSACESGLGEVMDGEGVYGLRRSFQLAGARTVISSLWPVYDKTTAQMMGNLYNSTGSPLFERMRSMQLEEIKKLRAAGLQDHPFLWAAFVASGGW